VCVSFAMASQSKQYGLTFPNQKPKPGVVMSMGGASRGPIKPALAAFQVRLSNQGLTYFYAKVHEMLGQRR